MLAAGAGRKAEDGDEAVSLVARNLRVPAGTNAEALLGRERMMVYRISLGAALLGAKRFDEAERELRATIAQNQDWKANHDLIWCTYHLLFQALDAQGKSEAAFAAGKQGLDAALKEPEEGFGSDVMRAAAARDYAAGAAKWPGSSQQDREAASQCLDRYCRETGNHFDVMAAALFESMPDASELRAIRKLLQARQP